LFKKLKTLVITLLTAAIFPTWRIQSDENTPARQTETSLPQDPTISPEQRIKDLESQLAAKDTELNQAKSQISGLDGNLKKTVAGYKALVLKSNPEILEELVKGETIETLDDSLAKAKDLTNKIKTGLQNQARNQRIPAGSPTRGREDHSLLSSREKIAQGLNRK
jgi:hypothetical protein